MTDTNTQVKAAATSAETAVETEVTKNPWTSVVLAFAAGLVIGAAVVALVF